MEIIYASQEQLDGIMDIERLSFTDPWSRAGVEAYLDDPFGGIFTALEAGRVLGYAIFHCSYEDSELYCIAVRPELRRHGTGRELLNAVMREAKRRGAERMYLEVRVSNAPARELYKNAGFAVCGRRRGYYENPTEDAILMDREL